MSGNPGDLSMKVPGYPYLYLIMMTYLENEIEKARESMYGKKYASPSGLYGG
jgi:hypothetical protein